MLRTESVIERLRAAKPSGADQVISTSVELPAMIRRKRSTEWGQRAIVVGAHPQIASWIRDFARRAVTVEQLADTVDLDTARVTAALVCARASIVILIGADATALAPSIVESHPEIAVVIVGVDDDKFDLFEQVSLTALPIEVIRAMRRALRSATLRRSIVQLREESTRRQTELDRLNADMRETLSRRHQALCDTKRSWERTFDAVENPLAVIDDGFVILNANRALAAVADLPVAHVPGRYCYEAVFGHKSPCSGCPVKSRNSSEEVTSSDGRVFEARATPLDDDSGTFVCTYRDLTDEHKKMEATIRAERMAALGEMSAGLAHELNNPIGGILAMTQALTRDPNLDAELALDLADIEEAALRSKGILRALMRYARGARDEPSSDLDVQVAVSDAILVTKAELRGAQVQLDLTTEPDVGAAIGCQASVQEAMVHLLRNAAHAVEAREDRELLPEISVRILREENEIWIEVADNGRGLPPGDTSSLLVPFVSDDPRAAGKGFGLALVSRLIEDCGGVVDLIQQHGAGATVRLKLKCAADVDKCAAADAIEAKTR